MIKALRTRFLELVTDPVDHRMSHTKIGVMIAGAAFTYKMVLDRPDDPVLWLVYMGTVGGYAVAKQFIHQRFGQSAENKE